MATLLKHPRDAVLVDTYLNWPWEGLDPTRQTLALNRFGQDDLLPLTVHERTPRGWRLSSQGFQLERWLLDDDRNLPVRVVAYDREAAAVVAGDLVSLEPSFAREMQDRIALYQRHPYRRPGRLAAFTHVCNEGTMLGQFLRHYGQWVDPGGLYVVNHGSEPGQIDPWRDRATVVDIPRGETDHLNIAAFCGHFQRFLLTQYDWVIHVDCDELLLSRREDGDLRALLDELPPGAILKPAEAWDLTHRVDDEPTMDWSRPVSLQRSRLFPNDAFCKPVLANRPTSWSVGFHECLEPAQSHPDLALVHLRDADWQHATVRDAKWARLPRSRFDQRLVGGGQAGSDAVRERLLSQASQPESIELPDWMRGRF